MAKYQANKILIIGMAGGLAQLTAKRIIKGNPLCKIIGIDNRPLNTKLPSTRVHFIKLRYTRGDFERLFREHSFDTIIHLGRISHANLESSNSLSRRLDLNLIGTKRILDLAEKFDIKKIIFLSTYHVYGALSDNPVFITEDYPLRASIKYPELRDVVELDQMTCSWMWKNQTSREMVILRPCSIIGPTIQNAMSRYLRGNWLPVCMDFNPMFQFIHEADMAKVIQFSLENIPLGVYNVAPEDVISIKEARKHLKLNSIPLPSLAMEQSLKAAKFFWKEIPEYLIDYIKHSCIIDASELKALLPKGFYQYNVRNSLEHLKN